MSTRDLQVLRGWAEEQAGDPRNPRGERRLWRQVAREVRAYESGGVLSTPAGSALCGVCREANGRHRSLSSGRYVTGHDASEGLLW